MREITTHRGLLFVFPTLDVDYGMSFMCLWFLFSSQVFKAADTHVPVPPGVGAAICRHELLVSAARRTSRKCRTLGLMLIAAMQMSEAQR